MGNAQTYHNRAGNPGNLLICYTISMVMLQSVTLAPGWEAPFFELPDTEGKLIKPTDFIDKQGLLLIFTCNHCPYAKAAWPILIDFYRQHHDAIGFVAISANDAELYPDDSPEAMKVKKEEWQIPFPYVHDESQTTAKAYQAQCTPDPYLFRLDDNTFKLYYHGRINDNWQQPEQVTQNNLKDAITNLIEGNPAPEIQPPSMGCSIKWKTG
jgi:peroxiredoxin